MDVSTLLAEIRAGRDEAAMTLGLLIERGSRGPQSDDEDIAQLLSPALAGTHLTAAEREQAVTGLISYLGDEPLPLPLAVWALAKSAETRAAQALIGVLTRTIDDARHEHLTYQALAGMIPIGGPDVMRAVRDSAARGHGKVGETARQYLEIVSK